MIRAFWAWYCAVVIICILSPDGRIFWGTIAMGGVWLLTVRYAANLRLLIARILPSPHARFWLIGILYSAVFMENLAINFRGDLHPNLAINSFLWLGAYLGWLGSWLFVQRKYAISWRQVFFLGGLMGVLIEQNGMIPRLVLSGQWFPAILSIPLIFVLYGAAIAPAFLLAEPVPPQGARQTQKKHLLIALTLTSLSFIGIGFLWIKAFQRTLEP